MTGFVRQTALATLLVAAIGVASAEDVSVKLTGADETPPVTTSASGEGKITIGKDMSVKGSVTTKGLMGTAAHIHEAPPGKAGPPIITLTKSGENTWTVPEGSKLTEEQYKAFKAGNLYVNVHSAEHKPGEIRGQLKP
ncbi:MAG TPA: CHRD domain-containing protein [Steroidobacteraceae bacterium]|nr:CHRD domain-containing protein [Steroidobacteraceae bacterium]